jgi:hypothetical protein
VTQLRPDAVRQQIARGATDPVYLIAGDDEHEKSALALAFGEMVEEGLRAFNVERLYATDKAMTALQVTEAARTLPMLAPRRIVIVLSAEKLLAPKKGKAGVETDGDDGGSGDLEPLMDYLQDPHPAREESPYHEGAREGRDACDLHGPRWRQGPLAVDRRSRKGRRTRDRPSGSDEDSPAGQR